MDLGAFDFRTGKMLMSKMNKSRQRVRYDSSNQVKVSCPTCSTQSHWNLGAGGGYSFRTTVVGNKSWYYN